jgi:hypothetical protein
LAAVDKAAHGRPAELWQIVSSKEPLGCRAFAVPLEPGVRTSAFERSPSVEVLRIDYKERPQQDEIVLELRDILWNFLAR